MVKVYLRRVDDDRGIGALAELSSLNAGPRKMYEFPEGNRIDKHEGWLIVQHITPEGEKPPAGARRNLFNEYTPLDLAAFPIEVVEAVLFENPDHSQLAEKKQPKEKK